MLSNTIFNDVLKAHNGVYVHATDFRCVWELKSNIESLVDELSSKYNNDEMKEFILSLDIIHVYTSELTDDENEVQEVEIYQFDLNSFVNDLLV